MMFNNVTINRHNDGKRFKAIATMTALNMLMLLITLSLLVLRASATATTLTASEINTFGAEENLKLRKNITAAADNKSTKPELRQFPFNGFMLPIPPLPALQPAPVPSGCPLCDSSVYSYCSHKLIHDSCCCDFPGAAIHQKPPQCASYDCRLLHAKSCYEHSLIKNCCCNNPY